MHYNHQKTHTPMGMKRMFISLYVVFLSFSGNAQNESSEIVEKDTSLILIPQDSLKENKPLRVSLDSLQDTWMVAYWDTINFNPYRKQVQKFPFNIVFTDSTFTSPIDRNKVVTSRYGWRNKRPHKGIDIDLITGDTVRAMFDGKVRYVNSHAGHGKTVIIRHHNGLETVYAHLNEQLVKVNDAITKGQVIGYGGTTGNARGSHLHLVVSYKGIYINPEYLFDFGKENEIRAKSIWVSKKWATPYIHSAKKQSEIVLCTSYEEALVYEQHKEQIHIIKKGDTLSRIANTYRVSIANICSANSIQKTTTLKIGQRLILTK